MFRCLKSGCPWRCGGWRRPGCFERLAAYVFAAAMLAVIGVSLASGVRQIRLLD